MEFTPKMHTKFFETVSGRELFENSDLDLSTNIDESEEEAQQIVEKGEQIREKHGHGNLNASRESTYEGAQKVANYLAKNVTLEDRKERFFGEHIREALAALRSLWKKR